MAQWNSYSSKTSPDDTDTLMLKDNSATGAPNKKLLFSGLWAWILGKLTNTTISALNTSPQTVIGGLNALNSKTYLLKEGTEITSGDLNTYTTPGSYFCKTNAAAASLSHCPVTSGFTMKVEYGLGTGTPRQTLVPYDANEVYVRSTATGTWVKQPTRSEVDAINGNFQIVRYTGVTNTSTQTLVDLGVFTVYGSAIIFLRVDSAYDGASVYFARRNSSGYQIIKVYEGTHEQTPIIDSNGVLKLKSYTSGITVHGAVITLAKWS